jgi:hypothetical protein
VTHTLSILIDYSLSQIGDSVTQIKIGTQKVKAIQLGYALGPVDLTASYAKNTDMLGVEGNDTDAAMIRFIGKF